MKTININQIKSKITSPLKKAAPFVASTMFAATALITSSKSEIKTEDRQSVPAALALATIAPAGLKRKKNEVEMISEDFIRIRKGKYLTEDEIQAYKDKWDFLNENNVLNENNKYIAHKLCQNPNIDKDTAFKSLFLLKHIINSSNDNNRKTRLSSMIIDSEKVDNKILPDTLYCALATGSVDEYSMSRFLNNIDFIYENIKPECYSNFMKYSNIKLQKIKPKNYKPEKITEEIIKLYESVVRGWQQANSFAQTFGRIGYDFERGCSYIETRKNTADYQKEIEIYLKNGKTVSEIADMYNTTEDCINALRFVTPENEYFCAELK